MTSNQRPIRAALTSISTILVAGSVLAFPCVSQAQGIDEFGRYGESDSPTDRQSPENFALELRLGPYLPQVDTEFSDGQTPFRDYFGSTHRVGVGAEFDWLPLKIKDTLRFGAGFGFMYTTIGGKGIIAKSLVPTPEQLALGITNPTPILSDQATKLNVLPHWIVAVLRIEALEKRTWVPLAFSAKVGLADSLWWISDEPKTRKARVDGVMTNISGRGRTYGVYYGLGVHLDLGFLDPLRRKRLDTFTGINRIYFFGELYSLELNAFGRSGNLNLTDRSWVLGISFDI